MYPTDYLLQSALLLPMFGYSDLVSSEKTDTPFDTDAWVERLVQASAGITPVSGTTSEDSADGSVVVHFKFGRASTAIVVIDQGRVVGLGEKANISLTLPMTVEQLDEYFDGTRSMSRDYMRGDLKPVGPTGHFISLLDVFENPEFVEAIAKQS